MKLKLKKGNKTIASSVEFLDTTLGRGIGIMFRSSGNVLLVAKNENTIETAIHTFFCRPLLVAWINSEHKVVAVKKTIPFWFYSSPKPAKYVFETTNLKTKLSPGDRVRFIAEKTNA